MRSADCIICGPTRKRLLQNQNFKDDYVELVDPRYQKESRRLVICESCGLVFHDPQFDGADLEVLYARFRDESFRKETPDAYFDRITGLPSDQSENAAKMEWLRSSIPACVAAGGDLLDIGCGGGVFIYSFLKAFSGWKPYGVEPTPAYAELARRRLAAPVITSAYRSGLHDGRQFNLITIHHVLEHVGDPVTFLRDVRNDLAENGLIYLSVPDIHDLSYLPQNHDRFMMEHCWIFSCVSLANVCRLAGYDVLLVDQQTSIRNWRNVIAVLRAGKKAHQAIVERESPDRVLELLQPGT